jgi:hypothetical protein
MKDIRYNRPQTRNGIASALLVVLVAAIVVVGPHFLETSPTTNTSTDLANGVTTTIPSAAAGPPRCDVLRRPTVMNLQGYLDLAAANVCVISTSGDATKHVRSFGLSAAQLHRLEADFNAHSTSQPTVNRACPGSRVSTVVAGVTVDGRPVMLFGSCTGEFAGIGRYWVPNPATLAAIGALTGRPRQR